MISRLTFCFVLGAFAALALHACSCGPITGTVEQPSRASPWGWKPDPVCECRLDAWVAVPLDLAAEVGWTAERLAYWRDPFGIVHLRGAILAGAETGDPQFVLPEGYRPAVLIRMPVTMSLSGTPGSGTVTIEPTGATYMWSEWGFEPGDRVWLDGISFLSEF